MQVGDLVIVKMPRKQFYGRISGEGRTGAWWLIIADGNKHAAGYHKNFCFQREDVMTEGIKADHLPHVINERRIGFVAEHGSRDRPIQEGK